jgi:hypothetical protein
VTLSDGRSLYNHVCSSVGYAGSSEPLVRLGLGSVERIARIEIRWPGGRTQTITDVAGDRVVDIEEELR